MKRQNGVALITVLLVVAVVTVVCAGLIARQQLSIRSSANQLHVIQAWHYAQGGETLAKAMLERDLRQGDPRQPVDHPLEPWARPLVFPLDEGGELRVRIVDPSARFNLNSLVRQGRPNELAVLRLRRLLLRLGIDKPYAERLLDWLDSDNELQGGNGAEDGQYLLATPPYRTANREITDVSELRLLLEMEEADYRRLLPFVSALPSEALLNVNTASAMVLSSLSDGLTPDAALALIAGRGTEGYASPAAFAAQPVLAGLGEQVVQGVAVGSQYFEVFSEVNLGERRVVLRSLLQRSNDGQVSILARDLGQGGMPPRPIEEEQE
ncbi:MAG: general secretion pathway protein GspK [Gammaproteobacteria bacterium HGW-Gammaproteobacteria-12]|nr:MAG: general secretion pathway protein GspK [Gammaproteobacteria bacterium HGW-Gammaproteobacteria-12]